MKSRLNKFSSFASCILPHEANFLLEYKKFEDSEKSSIVDTMIYNAALIENYAAYNDAIDKRKYSYIKNWCIKLLDSLDVDKTLEKLLVWEKLIMTDAITKEDEKELIKILKSSDSSHFNFIKLYDISRVYRHYLQIRLRYKDFEIVHQFIHKYRTDYEYSKLVNDKLHDATNEIINHFVHKKDTQNDWYPWLKSIFYNESLDGYSRLLAWIRIVFIAHNKRSYEILKDKFEYFDKMIKSGHFYSRRILVNFYSQYLLYHSSFQNLEKATYYGYLSIKEINNDYLYYVNNLVAILLRSRKPADAYDILRSSQNVAKESPNFHSKIGHTAFMIFALIDLQKTKQAENHAFVFLTAYKKEVFDHRWHLFFTAYFKAMLVSGNFPGIIKNYTTYKLKEKDDQYTESANYTPSIPWMYHLALYKIGDLTFQDLHKTLLDLRSKTKEYHSTMGNDDLIALTRIILKNDYNKLNLENSASEVLI
ncbi:MAG: hypothetical protein KA270_10760 [Saprospiraceae bacterium]|nr:hypothetical protein [Saprospiraceae bacterium]MBP6567639.1 hypothetical protein [Saprospiraceae bacterium]